MKTLLVVLAAFSVVTLHAGTAAAQSQGRVTVERAIIWRVDTSIIAATAKAGTVLDLVARSERWYEVVIPPSLSTGGVTRGLIARSQVELLPGSPEPPLRNLRGSTSPGRAAPRATAPVSTRRRNGPPLPGFVEVNGLFQSTPTDAQHGTFPVYAEQATFDISYALNTVPSLNGTVGGLLTTHLGFAGGVTWFSRDTSPTLTGTVPHPFFFNTPRPVSGTVGPLNRDEIAIHGQVRAVIPVNDRVRVMAFGGPSWFRVSQDVVTDFSFDETYPYDQATFKAATVASATKSRLGFNVGGDATFFLSRRFGVGFTVMYSWADLSLPAGTNTVDITAGGLQTGGGLRMRF